MNFQVLCILILLPFSMISFANDCDHKRLCKRMRNVVQQFESNPESKDKFKEVLATARLLVKKDCRLPSVQKKITVWRACFEFKDNTHGKTTSKYHELNYSEDEVLSWFRSIKKAGQASGQKFLNSEEFTSGLDGAYFCMFVDSESC